MRRLTLRISAFVPPACALTVALLAQEPRVSPSGTRSSFTQPRAVVTHSTAQPIANVAQTPLDFDTDVINVGGMHSTSTNDTRLTVPAGGAGLYLLHCATVFSPNSVGRLRSLSLRLNGSKSIRTNYAEFGGGHYFTITVERLHALTDGDYVECVAYQDSGARLNVGDPSDNGSMFLAAKIGDPVE